MRGTFPLFIAKLDPLGRVPKMLFKLEVLHSGRIGHWKIADTVDGSEITRALTVEWIIRRLARLLQEGIRTLAPARNDSEDLLESSDERAERACTSTET